MSMKSRHLLASKLAQFLRLNGNKVIDGSCKLSLTTSALCLVNSLFLDVLYQDGDRSSLQDASMEGLETDVRFLHDFIKKTTSLKLFHGMQTLRGGVDLSSFSNLTVLELRKIPTHLIIGLESLSQQLKALICTRSIYLLKELFGSCADEENVYVWTELKELNLSYNYLEGLDQSLKCLPELQIFDVSHNSIMHVDELQVLNKLVIMNLSFNQLDHLPLLNSLSCRSLKKLYIRNNNLEDLEGLECIFCLEEFDISYNCLSEYHVLNPLDKLKFLKVVNLEGNPLYFHRCHRELMARYFHPSVLSQGIMLDGKLLVSYEKLVPNPTPLRNVICQEASSRHQTSINMVVEDARNTIQMVPDEFDPSQGSPSISGKGSYDSKGALCDQNFTPVKKNDKFNGNVPRKKSSVTKKSKKMREALITDAEEDSEVVVPPDLTETKLPSHFEAKLDMEAKRRKHGEAWLIPEYSFLSTHTPKVPSNTPITGSIDAHPVQKIDLNSKVLTEALNPISTQCNVPSLNPTPKVPSNTPIISSIDAHSAQKSDLNSKILTEALNPISKQFEVTALNTVSTQSEVNLISTQSEVTALNPITTQSNVTASNQFSTQSNVAASNQFSTQSEVSSVPFVTAIDESNFEADNESVKEMKQRHVSQVSDDIEILIPPNHYVNSSDSNMNMNKHNIYDDLYKKSASEYSSDGDSDFEDKSYSDEESESQIFIVDRKKNSQEQTLFVNIGPKYIKEKHRLTGKVLDKLDLTRLASVELITPENEVTKKWEVLMRFDTIKASRQQRHYIFDDIKSAKNMISILKPFADAKILEEATIGALECLKCNSQFSKEAAHRKVMKTKLPDMVKDVLSSSHDSSKDYFEETDVCPNCGSNIVVEMETIPIPSMTPPQATPPSFIPLKIKPLENTPDNASVGSSSSGSFLSALFSTIKKSPMLTRKVDSAASNIRDQESVMPQLYDTLEHLSANDSSLSNETESSQAVLRRNSSDITVISNPSQSSIAVISELGIESDLNTIIEKSSQCSLSPPVSEMNSFVTDEKYGAYDQSSLIPKTHQDSINGNYLNRTETRSNPSTNKNQDDNTLDDSFERENDSLSDNPDFYETTSERLIYGLTGHTYTSEDENGEDESSKLFNLLRQKEVISNDAFTQLDHRLKLHLEINVFADEEHLDACLHVSFVPLATGEEFQGLFVISSVKVYVVKFLEPYRDEDIEKSIQIAHSSPLSQLKHIQLIMGSQGFSIACGSRNIVYTVLVRDADLCNSFSTLVTGIINSHSSNESPLELNPTNKDMLQQLKEEVIEIYHPEATKSEAPEILLHMFGFWKECGTGESLDPICIVVTPIEIFVLKVLYKKQDTSKDWQKKPLFHYSSVGHQKISDLLSLKLKKNLTDIELSFDDEENDNASTWLISTRTKSSLFSFVDSLKTPWELIFAVTLPLSMEEE